jgi:uncharacterized membrane protein
VKLQLLKYWDRIRSGFWFLPTAMAGASIVLSYATVSFDSALAARGTEVWSWLYTGGAEGASAVLTAISGSMITIAGLVFSMTLVAMSLAASNFGPRLLQNFMRDTANQLVLGTFVATFLYGLLVLRTIRRADEGAFVPHLSVSLAVLFALTSLGVLIYFIHHVAVSIQADEIIARVSQELNSRIESLYPQQVAQSPPDSVPRPRAAIPDGFEADAQPVVASGDGYLQLIDAEGLLELARNENAVFRIERRPGSYIVVGAPLLLVWPGARLSESVREAALAAFALGTQRTAAQDVEYLVGQLVEIAVRALSPGINDPFTAITCVDRLSSALTRLAQRQIPSGMRFDEQGNLRIITESTPFAAVLDTAFDPIRRYAHSSKDVTLRLLDAIAVIARALHRAEDREALQRQARLIMLGRSGLAARADRRQILQRYTDVSKLLCAQSIARAESANRGREAD